MIAEQGVTCMPGLVRVNINILLHYTLICNDDVYRALAMIVRFVSFTLIIPNDNIA